MAHPLITGPPRGQPGAQDPAVFRLEIRDLVKDKRQFSLYIQALRLMMEGKFEDPLSFVGIGGVHGLPNEAWGGAPPPDKAGGGRGYCAHGSFIFPTWHRPYVSLIEQEISRHANEIAKAYTKDIPDWRQAAESLRAPYWDWARRVAPGDPPVPAVFTTPTVDIVTPVGELKVPNPLYCHEFKEKHPHDTFNSPFIQWSTTIRHPTSSGPDAESNVEAFNATYGMNNPQMRTQTHRCLTELTTWEQFSNHQAIPRPANSLEQIHNTMHVLIGGTVVTSGHMSQVPVAGFDPIFYVHHANVDRLLALWQALNPNEWVPSEEKPGQVGVTSKTDLLPFWQTQTGFWNSEGVRNQALTLHYSYPEFKGLKDASASELREKILAQINELYGPPFLTRGAITEWTLHVKYNRDQLGTSYTVGVYLGDTYVGAVGSFANENADNCPNCDTTRGAESEGFVHLDDVLAEKVRAVRSELPLDGVRDVIRQQLSIRVAAEKPDHTPVDIARDLPSLKIAPFSEVVTYGRSGLPDLGTVTYYHDLVEGKPGGVPETQW